MRFDNAFEVKGSPSHVIGLFEDPRLLANFLPGASVGDPNPDGSYPGTLVVSFGPKRLSFKGTLTSAVRREQLAGEVSGHASADVRGAKMSVAMRYQLSECAEGTRVALESDAELTGMLAEFARTGGVLVTQALLEEFAQRMSAHVSKANAGAPAPKAKAAAAPANAPASLSMFALLWRMLRSRLHRRPARPAP